MKVAEPNERDSQTVSVLNSPNDRDGAPQLFHVGTEFFFSKRKMYFHIMVLRGQA
jgi:hypothetical protein